MSGKPRAKRSWLALLAAGVLGVSGFGCAQRAQSVAFGEGRSAFRFVQPPPPPGMGVSGEVAPGDPLQRYVAARPIGELASPVFPAAALGKLRAPMVVGVRITVGVDGRVTEVEPSIRIFSTPSPLSEDFFAAVRETVETWRFTPAELLQLETVDDPEGKFQRVKVRERVEAFAEVVFTFTADNAVEAGTGGD